MGKTNVSVSQMVKFYKNKATVSYPYSNVSEAPTIEKFCQIYKEESEVEGVKEMCIRDRENTYIINLQNLIL